MIPFFRNLRQRLFTEKNFSRYFFYALGEIILVVIGILIALQVNTWNENRKDLRITRSLLENLQEDVNEDLENLKSLKGLLEQRRKHAGFVLEALKHPGQIPDTTQLVIALTRTGWILNYTPTFATYKEILNSGRLSLIQSTELKKALADYQSQVEDNRRIEAAYEPGLKEAERIAIGHFEIPPLPSNALMPVPDAYKSCKIDLQALSRNAGYIENLKHIHFHTGMEIIYKETLIVPRAKRVAELIEQELQQIE